VPQPFRIVANFSHESASPRSHRARHRLLHVGVTRQRGIGLAGGEPIKRVNNVLGARAQLFDGVAQVQPNRSQHLIVSRTPQVYPAACCPNSLGQTLLQRRLPILVLE
jgi:hypothetical protein